MAMCVVVLLSVFVCDVVAACCTGLDVVQVTANDDVLQPDW